MLTGAAQSVAILATGTIYYAVDFWLIQRHDQLRSEDGSGRSWGYTALMIAALALLTAQPVVLPSLGLRISGPWGLALQALGAASIILALTLHWWSRAHLQQFYVEDVVFQEGHKLVDTGPYRYVRHPIFTSFMMIAVGLVFINPALPTLLLALYAFWDFRQAAAQEEALLCEKLDGYAEYIQRSGRFLPSLGSRE